MVEAHQSSVHPRSLLSQLIANTSQLDAKVVALERLVARKGTPLAGTSLAAFGSGDPCTQPPSDALAGQAAVAPAPVAAKFIPRSDAFAVGATVWINALASRPELNDTMAILNNVEEQVALPAGEMTALLAFIGKPAGDERSIALLGLCYRLLMQKHRPEMLEWNEKKTGWWGKARSGSSALRAGLARSRRCEVARELGLTAIMVLWGVSQFYDCISDHHRSCG